MKQGFSALSVLAVILVAFGVATATAQGTPMPAKPPRPRPALQPVAVASAQWTPMPVADDPLVRMPGTQPGQVALEAPGRCLNCHAG